MRVIVATTVLLSCASARADPDASPSPMDSAADVAEVCAAMRPSTAPDLPCKRVGRVAMTGGAIAEVYEVSDLGDTRWTIVIDERGAFSRSPTLELVRATCATHKCEYGEARRPRLRTIRRGAAVAIELSARFVLDVTDTSNGKVSTAAEWRTYDVVVCGAEPTGELRCVERHRGGRDESCTGALASDGRLVTTCTSTIE